MRSQDHTIRLTGDAVAGGYVIELDGVALPLSERLFRALCELVAALLAPDAKPVQLDRLVVCLLRKALDEATGQHGLGHDLIRTVRGGQKSTYFLALSPQQITVDPSLRHALTAGSISREVAERLLAIAAPRIETATRHARGKPHSPRRTKRTGRHRRRPDRTA